MLGEMTKKSFDKREKIKGAALDLFAKQGFAATSIREIEKKANLKSSALIYYYFKDKEELFWACIKEYKMPKFVMPSCNLEPIEFLIGLQEKLLEVCQDEHYYKVLKCTLNIELMEKDEYYEVNTGVKETFGLGLKDYLKKKMPGNRVTEEMDLEEVISNFYIIFIYRRLVSKSIKSGVTEKEKVNNHKLFKINAEMLIHILNI